MWKTNLCKWSKSLEDKFAASLKWRIFGHANLRWILRIERISLKYIHCSEVVGRVITEFLLKHNLSMLGQFPQSCKAFKSVYELMNEVNIRFTFSLCNFFVYFHICHVYLHLNIYTHHVLQKTPHYHNCWCSGHFCFKTHGGKRVKTLDG